MSTKANSARRPLRSRDTRWAAATARWLTRIGLRPNTISLLSVAFAGLAGGGFLTAGNATSSPVRIASFVVAAAAIQGRLLCNLFDGMVAVEGGYRTKSGEIYNELPDRFADTIILAAAGYSCRDYSWLPAAGWCASVLAVTTAYVRALGAAVGTGQHFNGPMAKPHRMAVMTVASLASAALEPFSVRGLAIAVALPLINVGCLVTIARRCRRIVHALEAK